MFEFLQEIFNNHFCLVGYLICVENDDWLDTNFIIQRDAANFLLNLENLIRDFKCLTLGFFKLYYCSTCSLNSCFLQVPVWSSYLFSCFSLQGQGDDIDYIEPKAIDFCNKVRAWQVSCGFNHTGAILEVDKEPL